MVFYWRADVPGGSVCAVVRCDAQTSIVEYEIGFHVYGRTIDRNGMSRASVIVRYIRLRIDSRR